MTCVPVAGAPTALMVYNVQSWGAKGDGTTKDTQCIQNAINAIPAGGGILFFPQTANGYFIDTDCLGVPQGVTIAGIAGFGFFTQSRLMRPTTCGLVIAADGATGVVSSTLGHIFDGSPGRPFANIPITGVDNFSSAAVRGANLGDWLLFSSTQYTTVTGDGTLQAIQNWSDDDMAHVQVSDLVPSASNNFRTVDPHAIMLENGHILCAFTAQTPRSGPTQSDIQVWLSTDGGRTWTLRSTLSGSSSQAFTVPYLIRIRQQTTTTANRVIMIFCDADPTQHRDTVFRTTYSNDEGMTWATQTVVTPSSGTNSAGLLNDANRASMIEDGNGNIQIFYCRSAGGNPIQIWQETCNNLGQSPTGTPSLIIPSVQFATSNVGTTYYGCYPVVARLRTFEYALYYTASNFNNGFLHLLTSPQAQMATWSRDRTIFETPSGLTIGFGLVVPLRKYQDGLELIFQYNGQPRSVFHYGV